MSTLYTLIRFSSHWLQHCRSGASPIAQPSRPGTRICYNYRSVASAVRFRAEQMSSKPVTTDAIARDAGSGTATAFETNTPDEPSMNVAVNAI